MVNGRHFIKYKAKHNINYDVTMAINDVIHLYICVSLVMCTEYF